MTSFFSIRGIPALVILDGANNEGGGGGNMITKKGRNDISGWKGGRGDDFKTIFDTWFFFFVLILSHFIISHHLVGV